MASFKNLTFLKVLATVAWADGEITESELNVLKKFYRKFNLEKRALDSLKPYLLAPIPKKEQDKLFRQLAAELDSESERQAVVAELEAMVNADQKIKAALMPSDVVGKGQFVIFAQRCDHVRFAAPNFFCLHR